MNTATEKWDGNVIDLGLLAARLWQKRWWILLSTVISALIFFFVALSITPIYRASTILMPASADRNGLGSSLNSALGQLGGLASLAGVNVGGGDSGTEEALAVLRSREFTERFIGENRMAPKLLSEEWDSLSKKPKALSGATSISAKAYRRFAEKIRSVSQDKKTGMVNLQIDWISPTEAAEWANKLVEQINAEMRARAIAKSDASIKYLEKELVATSEVGTRDAINRLIESQVKQRMLANVSQEFAFRVVDKAMAPDLDEPIKPKKILLIAAGVMVGILFGALLALFLSRSPSSPRKV